MHSYSVYSWQGDEGILPYFWKTLANFKKDGGNFYKEKEKKC